MKGICITLIIVISSCLHISTSLKRESRVFNGDSITIDKAPFAVQLRHLGRTYCGGTLIAPQYVITTAHCFNEYFFRLVTVVGGVDKVNGKGTEYKIKSVDIHPEYNGLDMNTDLAIIKLEKPMENANVKTISLCKQPLKVGNYVNIYGWGRTETSGVQPSDELKTARVPVSPLSECTKEYTEKRMKNMFCAKPEKGRHIYIGDSGSPVVYQGQVCGINAFIFGVGNSSAFTDVYALKDYIEESMKDLHETDWDY